MFKPILLGVALASAAFCAQAGVTAAVGQLPGSFIALTGGVGGNVSGGALYPDDFVALPYAATPYNASPLRETDGMWLAAGPDNTNNGPDHVNATLTLGGGITALSFLWGSADFYNKFTVNYTGGSVSYGGDKAKGGQWEFGGTWLGITLDGNQTVANYITFSADSGYITSVVFSSPGTNAIEIANVAVVPEPEAYGLALAGLSVVGFAMARRRKV
jgi:hypothetical protein